MPVNLEIFIFGFAKAQFLFPKTNFNSIVDQSGDCSGLLMP